MRALLVSAAVFAAGVPAAAADPARGDIVQTAAAGSFRTLVNLVVAADLYETLKSDGPFLVFAPTDEAFAKLPKGTVETLLKPENKDQLRAVLTYHVIPNKSKFNAEAAADGEKYPFATVNGKSVTVSKDGHGFFVNESRITGLNVACKNGSVQVIDKVLIPPADKTVKAMKPAKAGKNTIPVVAAKAGTFNTLLAAVTAAGLAETLAGDGPFTVFAPTDEAFAKLPAGTVETLLKPENKDQLVRILKYHVVAGKVLAKDAVVAGTAKTLAGESVTAGIRDGRLTINEAAVVKSDVPAANGVIHAIDRVLIPGK